MIQRLANVIYALRWIFAFGLFVMAYYGATVLVVVGSLRLLAALAGQTGAVHASYL